MQLAQPTTLTVQIVSSPLAIRDNNDPYGTSKSVPQVFIVEAVITNTGDVPAEDLQVTLDYNEDFATGWTLMQGETPLREEDQLLNGEAYHAYWFTRYPLNPLSGSLTHVYTVTAQALNAPQVSTSDNFYGNPAPGQTVRVKPAQNTGNSAVIKTSAEVIVGGLFTVTVDYDLGNNPSQVIFSPAGNSDFLPGAYRLLASTTRIYDKAGTSEMIVDDRLYFDVLPAFAEMAEVSYTFIAYGDSATRICPFNGAFSSASFHKYNTNYCQEDQGTIVPITSTRTLSLTQQVSSLTIQQSQRLTYTLQYTNTGTEALYDVWVWDDVDPTAGSILPSSIDPAADPGETTNNRAAWHLDAVPPSGQLGSTGVLTFTLLVDGNGQVLPDQTDIVNHAYWGANASGLPPEPVYTSTLTTTVQTPVITVGKTDDQVSTEPGNLFTYTLAITNTGSVPAHGLVVTDVLPAYLSVSGSVAPPADQQNGQTLVWTNLGPLDVGGGTIEIEIPVVSELTIPNGTLLTNTAEVGYQNPAGYLYPAETASDTTLVNGPVLSVVKSAAPDPVLAGGVLTYTLQYANDGPGVATNVVISDVVPANTMYLTCSGGLDCSESGGVVYWTIGTIPAHTSGAVDFSVQVSEDLQTGDQIFNQDYGVACDQTGFLSGPAVSTQVNRDAAFVQGFAFQDDNGNGLFDAGEAGISGVQVTLLGALVPVTNTDSTGFYSFRVEEQVPVSVTVELPTDFMATTPGTVYLPGLLFGSTSIVDFGMVPTTAPFGVVNGTVFEDTDHDGIQDLGESGLSGVSISSAEAVTPAVTTNDLGQYTLRYDESGPVTVTETDPALYVSTTPNMVNTVVSTGGEQEVDFGDFPGIKVSGQVFDDANANGVNDGEAGVPLAVVSAGSSSYTTGASGTYTLYVPVADGSPILVTETDPADYLSIGSMPGNGVSSIDANTLRIDSPASGTVYSANDFGDTRPVDLAVSKQSDPTAVAAGMPLTYTLFYTNQASVDALDVILTDTLPAEVVFGAVVSSNPELPPPTLSDQVLTWDLPVLEAGSSGTILFTVMVKPTASGSITNHLEIASSTPESDTSDNTDSVQTTIGIPTMATIYGRVFEDLDGDGIRDTGESGIQGVTITLDDAIVATTDPDGGYYFLTSEAGVHTVVESDPADYFSTTPNEVHVDVAMGASYQVDFGDAPDGSGFASVLGTVFDDANGNGMWDSEEPGLEGVTVTLDGLEQVTTNAFGSYTFNVTDAGTHVVTEDNLPGYFSTTPDEVHVDVVLDHAYQVDFGDAVEEGSDFSVVWGTVFEDANGDGVWGPGEIGLPGVTVTLDGLEQVTTDAYGGYTFALITPGVHRVIETDLAGYFSTTPNEVHVNVAAGNSYQVDFGDAAQGSGFAPIWGTVFDDANGDGEWDSGEPGLPGVTVTLDGLEQVTTNAFGNYTFAVTAPGTHTLAETDPPGYLSTTPNRAAFDVVLGKHYKANFGDRAVSVCQPDSYEQDDTFAQAASIQVGPDGRQNHNFCDDAVDWLAFPVQAQGVYTITTVATGLRADTFLALYDALGNSVLTADDDYQGAVDYSSRLVWQANADGVYYLLTENRAGLTSSDTEYEIWIEEAKPEQPGGYQVVLPMIINSKVGAVSMASVSSPLGVIDHFCPDDFEVDDTWWQAGPIVAGVAQTHSFDSNPALFAADKDFVWFDLSSNQTITLTVTAMRNTQTRLELYDAQGEVLNLAGSSQLVWKAPAAGRYYLGISPQNPVDFGCADLVGYDLLAEVSSTNTNRLNFIPLVMR